MTHGTLYVNRPLKNAQDVIAWAKSQGFKTTLPAKDMHVTVVYSKTPLAWPAGKTDQITADNKSGRAVQRLGDEGAIVLKFKDKTLQDRNKELLELGAKSDYDSYIPHVTISYNGAGVDLDAVEPCAVNHLGQRTFTVWIYDTGKPRGLHDLRSKYAAVGMLGVFRSQPAAERAMRIEGIQMLAGPTP